MNGLVCAQADERDCCCPAPASKCCGALPLKLAHERDGTAATIGCLHFVILYFLSVRVIFYFGHKNFPIYTIFSTLIHLLYLYSIPNTRSWNPRVSLLFSLPKVLSLGLPPSAAPSPLPAPPHQVDPRAAVEAHQCGGDGGPRGLIPSSHSPSCSGRVQAQRRVVAVASSLRRGARPALCGSVAAELDGS